MTNELDQLQAMAREVLSSEREAAAWMNRAHPILDGATPAQAARTEEGAELVRDLIIGMRYGFAV